MRARIIAAITIAVVVGFIFLFARKVPAQSTELHVFASMGTKAALTELLPRAEKLTGRRIVPQFSTSKEASGKIESGEPFDVAIISSGEIDRLIKLGKVAAGARAEFARVGMGIGFRAGAPRPDVSTAAALKQTFLKAKFIAFNPNGASVDNFNNMFARLGISDDVKPKLLPDSRTGGTQMDVAEGKADLVLTLIPEVELWPGVKLAGSLPADFQTYSNFAAGVAVGTQNAEAAKTLIKFITGPSAVPVFKAKGMELPTN